MTTLEAPRGETTMTSLAFPRATVWTGISQFLGCDARRASRIVLWQRWPECATYRLKSKAGRRAKASSVPARTVCPWRVGGRDSLFPAVAAPGQKDSRKGEDRWLSYSTRVNSMIL